MRYILYFFRYDRWWLFLLFLTVSLLLFLLLLRQFLLGMRLVKHLILHGHGNLLSVFLLSLPVWFLQLYVDLNAFC